MTGMATSWKIMPGMALVKAPATKAAKVKPWPFSRQHRIGEGSRIDPKGCCEFYQEKIR